MDINQGKKNSYSSNSSAEPVFYEIKVRGQLDSLWSKWFEGMTLRHVENGESRETCTMISGPVIDQPALHGLLTKIRDLNLTLISIYRRVPGTKAVEEVLIRPEPPGDRDDLRNKS